jgi:hypothetical protein
VTDRDDVLLRWQTEEATVRARLAAPGVASPQDVKASSGIEFLHRIFNGELPSPPIGETLGFVPIAAEPGRIIFQGTPTSVITIRSAGCTAVTSARYSTPRSVSQSIRCSRRALGIRHWSSK